MASLVEPTTHFKWNKYQLLTNISQKNGRGGNTPNSFFEVNITLILKSKTSQEKITAYQYLL